MRKLFILTLTNSIFEIFGDKHAFCHKDVAGNTAGAPGQSAKSLEAGQRRELGRNCQPAGLEVQLPGEHDHDQRVRQVPGGNVPRSVPAGAREDRQPQDGGGDHGAEEEEEHPDSEAWLLC